MKYIEKNIEDAQTGAKVTCHAISGLNVDYLNHSTHISVASYVSAQKKSEGKLSLSINTFTIPAVPDWSQVPYEWALNELIKPQPEDFEPENYAGYINPYLFSGGKLKQESELDEMK
ncbi:hypothetical protein EV693_105111 [Nicoletella semolina]|uniref:Uncharacterized protein n=1 Tax=Nicoletella semolina TaxID=271160 RepID=A0A4R2N9G2_9PAST|nr:hypothetical protein [Nicoletella semolina]MDH2923803.1 hypothetical protein [Nicoletella semolina]TCP17642.1 hypothetical protein EV693_105111 [Nicoletella semolina]